MKTFKEVLPEYKLKKDVSAGIHKAKISSSQDSYEIIKQFYEDDLDLYESFFILLLNRSNNTMGYVKISQGGIAGTVCDPELITYYAIKSLASSIILAHNHPSGNLKPSTADIQITKRILDILNKLTTLVDIRLLDHVIISSEGFYSFADEGII